MKKIKITEKQARMLESLSTKKVLKITKEQYDKILQTEMYDRSINDIKENINIDELYKNFVNELYNVNEGGGKKIYEKLCKLMEAAGILENGKIKKEMFNADKKRVKEVITRGLYEMACGKSEYAAMEAIEEALKPEDIKPELVKQLEPKQSTKTPEEIAAVINAKRKEALAGREELKNPIQRVKEEMGYKRVNLPEPKFKTVYLNDENNAKIAILKNKEGDLILFNYHHLDNSDFLEIADKLDKVSREYLGRDEDDMPEIEYGDFEIDRDIIDYYVGANMKDLSKGNSVEGFLDGDEIVMIDDNLKAKLKDRYGDIDFDELNEYTTTASANVDITALTGPIFKSNVPSELEGLKKN